MQTSFTIKTSKNQELIDITSEVEKIISSSKIENGIANIFTSHATAAIIINENYDPNICIDTINCLSSLIPQGKWLHDKIDNNAAAHIKASILGPSENIPIKDKKLQLGTWQALILCDFDGPRERKIIITLIPSETYINKS